MKKKFIAIILILLVVLFLNTQTRSHAQIKVGTFVPSDIITPTIAAAKPTATKTPPGSTIKPINNLNPEELVASVSQSKIKGYIENLVDDDDTPGKDETQTRYSGTSGNDTEAKYIKSQFESDGLATSLQPFSFGTTHTNNIIGRMEGTSAETYMVTAHMDSTAQTHSGVVDPAPGADDNATGTAIVMETGHVLSQLKGKLKYSIEFVAFSGEEQGLYGSYAYVKNLGSKKIKGVINLDMIGNKGGSDCVDFGYKPYNGGDVMTAKLVSMVSKYSIPMQITQGPSSVEASDHARFWAVGIPAVYGAECVFSPVYHSISDKTDKLSYSQITGTAKAVVGTLLELTK